MHASNANNAMLSSRRIRALTMVALLRLSDEEDVNEASIVHR